MGIDPAEHRSRGNNALCTAYVLRNGRQTNMRIPRAAAERVPIGARIVNIEHMSRAFVKYHLDDGRALHRFTREEPHADPHDHPFGFETTILDGGYVEEVFTFDEHGWRGTLVHRLPGQTYWVDAVHIHRIVELPQRECWTLVRAGHHERETRFWRFGNQVKSRAWHARKWIAHA
ncbi:hypothetical protein [Sphingomonas sp. R86521]|uniref:hypothetical protein n=1 Tax=Sphingomonas sp. R86521 TaxID=3093860 RepID=UPI0036D2EBCF